jgi:hypothetical protein
MNSLWVCVELRYPDVRFWPISACRERQKSAVDSTGKPKTGTDLFFDENGKVLFFRPPFGHRSAPFFSRFFNGGIPSLSNPLPHHWL